MLGPIGFAAPWVLAALAVLPVLWLILRAMPPAPRQLVFPGVALLQGLADKVPVARRTPWWLLLLRLTAIAALIFACAGPSWRPAPPLSGGSGPLLVVLDAGWAAAPDWPVRLTQAESALNVAAAAGRPAAVIVADGRPMPGPLPFAAADALVGTVRAARPVSWTSALAGDPNAALSDLPEGALSTLWISDGIDHPNRARWLAALNEHGTVTVVPSARAIRSLVIEEAETPFLTLRSTDQDSPAILAIGPDPQGVERQLASLTPGDAAVTDGVFTRPVAIDLPPELRNRITRFEIQGERHAGAIVLTDDRVKRRKVALVGQADNRAEGQVLLSPLHYLRQALSPTTDLVEGSLGDVLNTAPDVIVLVDQIGLPDMPALSGWVDGGGLLIRFAGPRMAASDKLQSEPLLPVGLRQGGRDIGGALSWGDPRGIQPFAPDSVFAGLIPPDEVAIRAQLMAQPAPDLADRTLASLSDDTPLVTRARQGQGQVVLFHVTANAEWSGLPVSGLFVQMLNRLVQTARVPAPEAQRAEDRAQSFWTPRIELDGFGRTHPAEGGTPVPVDDLAAGPAFDRPAGIYEAGDRRLALNAGGPLVMADWPGAVIDTAAARQGRDLRGLLLAIAAALLAIDALGSALIARGVRIASVLLAVVLIQPIPPADAQQAAPGQNTALDPELVRAANQVALAYVVTGDAAVDQASRNGLRGLSMVLGQRTSVEPGEPVAIDLDRDDLSVLSFLYWPVTDVQAPPSPQAYMRLNNFMRAGGMILFDTRDGDVAGVGGPDMSRFLQTLAAPLDVPPLAPVPNDHVLTRTFYLLTDFPGRWNGNPVWLEAPLPGVEATEGMPFRHLNDGVSPVVIGGNSWAEAWAIDDSGYPSFPVGSGWDGETQREMAYRFGVNLVMYVLTGNYKSDQVHVPALLDRLRIEKATPP